MNREYQLSFCQTCKNKGFNLQKGIVCSLTDEVATFERSCPDYIEDPEAKLEYESRQQEKKEMDIEEESFGLSKSFGVKNGIVAGQIAVGIAVLWFFGGIFFLDRIFFYPLFLLVIGIITWYKGSNRKKEENFQDWTKS